MKKAFLLLIFFGALVFLILLWWQKNNLTITNPSLKKIDIADNNPLDKYTFDALAKTIFPPSQIELGRIIKDENEFQSYIFYFHIDDRKVSGQINIPQKEGVYPIIVMFRGYVDREKYTTGIGTQHAAEYLARNNFITLAPDFLGYGESDNPSNLPIEERFQTYTTALTLIASLDNLTNALKQIGSEAKPDVNNIGLWGHSNGGQIALSVLEISQKKYPTVLWAPVSKPFPYSILYFTDDFDDHGKMLRRVVAEFENDYDSELYSLTNYFDRINSPIQLHQGTADESVPIKWSDQLADELNKLNKTIRYHTYSGEDHNFSRGNWQTVIDRSKTFYLSYF
ncbi:hypothetical protein A3A48_04365 [Candidatus Curtissbacteria bacterium RIFCSPLOWO2_01_FULL_37_9]|uniref:Peptidase S9 prolyl oligopeptidase catalytic domain-containing protein n=1 Tax=Candidatus Curtissbacteria bacterium RIFCSPLOWO2_01_FULL_37_9 TaxID=1797724 RepID=A0A1F5GPW0_9BACT|nr:MAG: hypothetical protein A3A48_04365 [Candidatus Curtissbacteria bacterium RIFCSPLOWO2_01_FULL_37_9]